MAVFGAFGVATVLPQTTQNVLDRPLLALGDGTKESRLADINDLSSLIHTSLLDGGVAIEIAKDRSRRALQFAGGEVDQALGLLEGGDHLLGGVFFLGHAQPE